MDAIILLEDGQPDTRALQVVEQACALLAGTRSAVRVLYVIPDASLHGVDGCRPDGWDISEPALARGRAALAAAERRLRAGGVEGEVTTRSVSGNPQAAVLRAVVEMDADVTVLGYSVPANPLRSS